MPFISEHERLVPGPPERVWRRHTEVADWPVWNPDVVAVGCAAPLAHGNAFTAITVTGSRRISVYALVPDELLLIWGGDLPGGGSWLQSWTFEQCGAGVRVSASTSVSGVPSSAVDEAAARLDAGLEAWIYRLRLDAEAPAARDA